MKIILKTIVTVNSYMDLFKKDNNYFASFSTF
mgnify:CR=1 FL=1